MSPDDRPPALGENGHMAFARGDLVHVPGLGTGVLREARGGNRSAIEIKGRLIVVADVDIEPAAAKKRRPHKSTARATGGDAEPPADANVPRGGSATEHRPARATAPAGVPELDLHGKTVPEAVEALAAFLNDALLDGHAEAHIIHGRSGGRVKKAVHLHLRSMPAVAAFHLSPHNPGLTIVRLS